MLKRLDAGGAKVFLRISAGSGRLAAMIDADSINYSPCWAFSDSEIWMLLDQI